MKNRILLVLGMIALVCFERSAQACMGPAEYFSVIVPGAPSMLEMMNKEVIVGDVIIIDLDKLSISAGIENLFSIKQGKRVVGTTEKLAYYRVAEEGSFTIKSKDSSVTLTAKEPPKTRGGCGDHRSPASVNGTKK